MTKPETDLIPIRTDLARLVPGHPQDSNWPALLGKRRRPPAAKLTATSRRVCPDCGALVGTALTYRGEQPWYYWQVCPCQNERIAAYQARIAARAEAERQSQADHLLGDSGMRKIAHLTLESFDPTRLVGAEEHPYRVVVAWLDAIAAYGSCGDYRDPAAPETALFFYCPGKGRGKTHLGAAALWEARIRHRRLTAFIEETSYLERCWSCPMEQKESLAVLPGERAWLTVVDDLGRREIGQSATGVQNAWAAVFTRRWLARGWTIITSNWTLDELMQRRTIDDALYSRIKQMTRGAYVFFDGVDMRLAGLS